MAWREFGKGGREVGRQGGREAGREGGREGARQGGSEGGSGRVEWVRIQNVSYLTGR